jgi:hypothetical protein
MGWNLYGATRTNQLRLDAEAPEKPNGPAGRTTENAPSLEHPGRSGFGCLAHGERPSGREAKLQR